MDLLAEAGGLKLWMDDSWSVSFFSSPYVGHRLLSAVDIYQGADFGEEAFSPVSGVVHKIMRFDSPSPGGGSLPEYLILIGKNHSLARIMHVEPSVSEGELVRVGEPIGIFIKNGFFSYWVDAGMHVEVRKKTSIMRSTGGLELKPAPALTETNGYSDESVSLKGRVMRSTERNTVVELNHENNVKVGDKICRVDGTTSLDYCGLLGAYDLGSVVYFNGIELGKVKHKGSYMSLVENNPLIVYVDGTRFRGLSFGLGCERIKLLPPHYPGPVYERDSMLDVVIENEG
ncbi:MAG: hypothetical protein B6U97_01315 [Candidatus Altiarchaeales archaeon ex4484_96]|nr:MAG: hypothetical protein B6U97_01315 [Candidatus Altiarchaeales archaeon ex4484_96]